MRVLLMLCSLLIFFNVYSQIDLESTFPVDVKNCNRDTVQYSTGYYTVYYNNGFDQRDTLFVQYGLDEYNPLGKLISCTRGNASYHYTIRYNEDGTIESIVYGFGDIFGTAMSFFHDGSIKCIGSTANNQWDGWAIYFDDEGNEIKREFYENGMQVPIPQK